MSRRSFVGILLVVAGLQSVPARAESPNADSCTALRNVTVADTTITNSVLVSGDGLDPGVLPGRWTHHDAR